MKMFNKRELEVIKWALYGELKRSKGRLDKNMAVVTGEYGLHRTCHKLQRLIDKTIKILAGTEV